MLTLFDTAFIAQVSSMQAVIIINSTFGVDFQDSLIGDIIGDGSTGVPEMAIIHVVP